MLFYSAHYLHNWHLIALDSLDHLLLMDMGLFLIAY